MATQPVSGKSQDPNISLIPKPCLFDHFLEKCFSRYISRNTYVRIILDAC